MKETKNSRMYVYSGNRKYDVIPLLDALRLRGFPLELLADGDRIREPATVMVAFNPESRALLNSGGRPFAFCSGSMLFTFCRCRPQGNEGWYLTNQEFAIVADIKKTEHIESDGRSWTSDELIYKIVEPC